jgi:Zn-dependent protease with chaperone function
LLKAWLNPKWRIVIFLSVLNAAWIFASWNWLTRESWLWITPVALSINALLLTYDQVLRFKSLRGRRLHGHDGWGLLKLVNDLSVKHQVKTPEIYLARQPSAQILAYGKVGGGGRLIITDGTLKLLNAKELEAVLTYQILAIKGSYHVMNYWMGALLDLAYRGGKLLERGFAVIFGWSPPLAAYLISPWLAFLQIFLVSRKDFVKLDRATARVLANPEDLARALWKMESYAQTQPWNDAWTFAHMCMVSPLRRARVLGFFHVQPRLQNRIKSLIGRYPL